MEKNLHNCTYETNIYNCIRGKVLLVYTRRPGTASFYQMTEPLGLKVLAAFIEEKGYDTKVFSGPVHMAFSAIQNELLEHGLDAVGFYCDYENCSAVESFCRTVKNNWALKVFVGGPQAVAIGEDFLKKSSCDAVVRGEGEYPLYELLEYFLHGCGDIESIAGVTYLNKYNQVVTVASRPPISDLDALPLRKPGKDWTACESKRLLALLTGRGCPFNCAFCYEGSVPGKVRLRSVENVSMEIRAALRYNPEIKYIWFADDTFTLDPKRIEAFCLELAALRKNYDFVWFCECHPITMIKWPDMLSMMIESGLVRMQIGIESGAPSVISLYKKQVSVEQIQDVVQLCYKQGLPQLTGNIIVGGAIETRQTFEETKKFASHLLNLGAGMVDITSTFFLPLPNTALTCNPSKFGLNIIDMDSLTSVGGDIAIAETVELSIEEITSMRLEFTKHICTEMQRLKEEKKVSHDRILCDFRLKINYGIESNWHKMVYSYDYALKNYYTMLVQDLITSSNHIPINKLWDLNPQRTIKLWKCVNFNNSIPTIDGRELSPLEFELILLCTGANTLQQIAKFSYSNFKKYYPCREDFFKKVIELMQLFEVYHWVGYSG